MGEKRKRECPNCGMLNDVSSVNCTFCGRAFNAQKRKNRQKTQFLMADAEKKATVRTRRKGPGSSSDNGLIDGSTLSTANNRFMGWADIEDGAGGELDNAQNGELEGPVRNKDENKMQVTEESAEVIGKCKKCGRSLFNTRYQPEVQRFLEQHGISGNFHKYFKQGILFLCPRCLNLKLRQFEERKSR